MLLYRAVSAVLWWALLGLWASCTAAPNPCDAGAACIFKGKADGWELYKESLGPKPPPIKSDSWSHSHTTIFYSISSYRDELCPRTLFNAYTKATHPGRVHIGVVQQNLEGDIDCLERYCEMMMEARNLTRNQCPFENQITMNRQRAEDAKGPTWARAIGSTMLRDEEFCMQTDSHMDFVRNWDKNLLAAWAMTENEYAVLSTYVTAIEELPKVEDGQRGINNQHECPHLCMITYGANQLVRNWGTKCVRNLPKPKMTNIVWGAGLSFSKCHAERKTMYDPFTPGIFDGEEFTKAIKLWTYGYDIYSPHRVYVVHDYHKSQGNPIHSNWARSPIPPEEKARGILRLKTVCGLPGGISDPEEALALIKSKYGLGDRRTMEQAVQFSGFALHNRTSLRNRCGNIDHVPFTEHPSGAEYIPRFDPVTFEPLDEPDVGSIYYEADKLVLRQQLAVTLPPKIGTEKPVLPRGSDVGSSMRGGLRRDSEEAQSQPLLSREKSKISDQLRREKIEASKKNSWLHAVAFVAITLGPVSVVMCCLGRCNFISSRLSGLLSDNKVSRKYT